MDFSETFDTIIHELLLTKLQICYFKKDALKTIQNYLKNRYQKTKVSKVLSSWSEIFDNEQR